MNLINTAIILDGGNNSKFLDTTKPKGLLNFHGITIFERQVNQLKKIGIKNIIVSGHYYSDEFDEFIKLNQDKFSGINIYSSKERSPLGSGGAIKNNMLNTNTELVIALNGTSFVHADLSKMVDFHFSNNFENTICITKSSNAKHTYSFEVKDKVISKAYFGVEHSKDHFFNAGIYIFNIDIFNVTHLYQFSLSKEILPLCCDGSLGAFETQSPLLTLDTEESYQNTLEKLK